MVSIVGICNSGLIKLGAGTVMSLTEGSKNADLCNAQFGGLRDDLLRAHNWNFAVARRSLARQAGAHCTVGFAYAYPLPSDWLHTLSVHGDGSAVPYRIEGRHLLSDASDICLRYIRRVEDPNEMDAAFREVLSWRIATDLAQPITQSGTIQARMHEGFRDALLRARSVDAIEDFPEALPESSGNAVMRTAQGAGMRLAQMLNLYRVAHKTSFRGLAPEIGISVPTLCRIEQGRPVSVANLVKLLTWMCGEQG